MQRSIAAGLLNLQLGMRISAGHVCRASWPKLPPASSCACTLTELKKGVSDSVVARNHVRAIFKWQSMVTQMIQRIWIYLIKLAWKFSVYSKMSVRTCCVSPDQRLPSMGWRGSHVIIEKIKMAKRQPLR